MSSRADELHQDLLEQVARLRISDEWLEAMVTAARFHDYSFGNWLLLWSQAEQRGTTVTRPAGYRRWQSMGRQVRKGERGYGILAPVIRKVTVDRAGGEDTELRVVGFRVLAVFDPLSRVFGWSTRGLSVWLGLAVPAMAGGRQLAAAASRARVWLCSMRPKTGRALFLGWA